MSDKKRKLWVGDAHDHSCSWKEKALASEEALHTVKKELNKSQRKGQAKNQGISSLKLKADPTTRASEVSGRRYRDEKQELTTKSNRDIKESKALYEVGTANLAYSKDRDINKIKTKMLEYERVTAVAQSELFDYKRTVEARYKQELEELTTANEELLEANKALQSKLDAVRQTCDPTFTTQAIDERPFATHRNFEHLDGPRENYTYENHVEKTIYKQGQAGQGIPHQVRLQPVLGPRSLPDLLQDQAVLQDPWSRVPPSRSHRERTSLYSPPEAQGP